MGVVFLDESGDPGMRFTQGSSHLLVMAAAYFGKREDYLAWRDSLDGWLGKRREFKFSDATSGARTSFGYRSLECGWRWSAQVCDKTQLRKHHDPEDLYRRVAGYLLDKVSRYASPGSAVVFDDRSFRSGEEGLLEAMTKAPRQTNPWGTRPGGAFTPDVFTRVERRDSRKVHGLQLADYLAGAVAHAQRSEDDAGRWESIVRERGKASFWPS